MTDADCSGTRIWLVLMKAHRALAQHAAAGIPPELGFSDFAVLEVLLHKGCQPVNAIGRRVALTSGAITSAVDRLERQGLVQRGFDASDRRVRQVSLTDEGAALIREVFAAHKARLDAAAEGLSEAERATLIDLLKKLGTTAQERSPTCHKGEQP